MQTSLGTFRLLRAKPGICQFYIKSSHFATFFPFKFFFITLDFFLFFNFTRSHRKNQNCTDFGKMLPISNPISTIRNSCLHKFLIFLKIILPFSTICYSLINGSIFLIKIVINFQKSWGNKFALLIICYLNNAYTVNKNTFWFSSLN